VENYTKKAKCRCFRLVYSLTPVLISTLHLHDESIILHRPRLLKIIASRSSNDHWKIESILLFVRIFTLTKPLLFYQIIINSESKLTSLYSLAAGNGTADQRLRKLPGALGRQLDFACLGDVRLILYSSAPFLWPKTRSRHDREFALPSQNTRVHLAKKSIYRFVLKRGYLRTASCSWKYNRVIDKAFKRTSQGRYLVP
jgi:hypothetical protein